MASGGTAPLIAMANPPHSLMDQSSTISSPLSEVVEDKDTDLMDIDVKSSVSDDEEPDRPTRGRSVVPPNNDDSDSLSEIDSEASTERLFDTPRKSITQPSNTGTNADVEKEAQPDPNPPTFQRSPSKLQDQIRTDVEADSGDDNEDLSEGSAAESEPGSDKKDGKSQKKSRSLPHKSRPSHNMANHGDEALADFRKRKRIPQADQSDNIEHPRKRAGSVLEPGGGTSPLSKVMSKDLPPTDTGVKSADQSDAEHIDTVKDAEHVAQSVETHESSRPKKSKRSNAKRRKGSEEEVVEEAPGAEEAPAEHERAVEDEPIETAEVDEEAEIAHRNEEELEKKRHAFDQLGTIEKQFAVLRDRLYEERLAQLNEEQALLEGDNPTHPEYLAMMQCIDSRRDDRLRVSELEYKFNMDALDRWAVARRTQILSQFYQSVRESRERTLDELGKQWYEIQHERRKNANPIPDYGFRFPKTKALQKKQAIAHSKETSILAGIAQHHGFPAAPEMKPASQAEIEEDFEAMHRPRQNVLGAAQPPVQHAQPAAHEYGNVPLGRNLGPTNLGPAAEQFLEQTPWANPRHPSHGSRRHSHGTYAGPPAFANPPKPFHQQGGAAWFAHGQHNGDSAHKHVAAPDQETGHARKTAETAKTKHETVVL